MNFLSTLKSRLGHQSRLVLPSLLITSPEDFNLSKPKGQLASFAMSSLDSFGLELHEEDTWLLE